MATPGSSESGVPVCGLHKTPCWLSDEEKELTLKHSITHDLPHELACKATRLALDSYRDNFSQYSPTGKWLNDETAELSFTVMGNTLRGRVDMRPGAIDLDLKVPFMWRIFKKQAIKVIEGEIRTWIAKAKAGELDDQ